MSKVVQLIPLNLPRLDEILVLILLWGSPIMTWNTTELKPSVSVMLSIHDWEQKTSNNELVWILNSFYCLGESSNPMITSSNGNIFRVTGPGGFPPQMRTFETNDWANSPCAFVNVFLVWKLYFDSSFNLKSHPFHGYMYHGTPWKKLL